MTTYFRRYTANPAFAQVVDSALDQSLSRLPDGHELGSHEHASSRSSTGSAARRCAATTSSTTLKPATQIARRAAPRRPVRRRRRDEPEDGRGLRDGVVAELQREPPPAAGRPGEGREDQRRRPLRPGLRRAQPRDAGPLSAGLDVQDGHRRRPRSTPARCTPTTVFNDPGYCIEYGKQVYNSGNPDAPGRPEAFGYVTLRRRRFEHSINAVFCNVGKQLGAAKILDYAKRFGFYTSPPLETPPSDRRSERPLPDPRHRPPYLWFPKDPARQVDVGRLAFGQEQDARHAAPDGARRARRSRTTATSPSRTSSRSVTAPNGSVVSKTKPQTLGHPISPKTAAELNQMMQLVVAGRHRHRARRSPAISVAGKTGTAETNVLGNVYDAWFVCFAPANDPRSRSLSSSRSSRTASAARSPRRSPRPSSKTSCTADPVSRL